MRIFILNLKKILVAFLCILFLAFLLIFSSSNIISAQKGLYLWANSVVPTLFPFFIATELLYHTNIIYICEKKIGKHLKQIFNLSEKSFFPIIVGTLSGYPTGAKIINKLRENKEITKIEGEHLLAFTNNSGPLFIIGTIGTNIFCSKKIGILLLLTHLLAAFTVGFLFKFWNPNRKFLNTKNITHSNLDDSLSLVLVNSVTQSVITILNIGRIYCIVFSNYIYF